MMTIDAIETNAFKPIEIDFKEQLIGLHKSFSSKLMPENGVYGVSEVVKDNGLVERIGTNEFGHKFKEYVVDGQITKRRDVLGESSFATTYFDDNGTAYLKSVFQKEGNTLTRVGDSLSTNTLIKKGNFSVQTDVYGRPVMNRIENLTVRAVNEKRQNLGGIELDNFAKVGDEKGHIIADRLGGPASCENVIAQLGHVNKSEFKKVENIVAELKTQGHEVTYEVKTNYVGSKGTRPSSFEPKIYVDGKEYTGLPDNLKKILNEADQSAIKKVTTGVAEKYGIAHETGVKSGLVAAGLTCAMSTAENMALFVDGEISVEDMVIDITKETAAAGALGYGTAFITTATSQAMSHSSSVLLQRVGGSCLPGAVASFAVESYDSISDYAQGKKDAAELAFDLGDNASSVAGGLAGAKAGAMVGSLAGPAGTVAGTLVGGMVGCVVASEAYKSAVEVGAEKADVLADKAELLAKNTIDTVKSAMPEHVDDVKSAFSDFIKENNLPFSV